MRFPFIAALAALSLLPATALAQGGAKPNDAQIAHIAYTAGEIDIAAAKQALAKSKNKEVRAFAENMVKDHTAVNKKALALVKKLKVKPQDNPTSQTLSKQAKEKRAELAKLKGAAFDKAYVDNEVAYHKAVDSALETQLIPSASNAELKSLLETGLKIFQGHEQHAEHVASELKRKEDEAMQPGRFALIAGVLCTFCAVPAQAATIDVVMQNLAVKPAEVTAKVGDTIRWDNKDFVAHTATATDKSFDVMLPPGKSGSTVVKKAGTFDYICKFHPNMKAKITVAP